MEYTLENYKAELAKIEEEVKERKHKLAREFAQGNNPYKLGDIITDGTNTIQITKFKLSIGWGNELPCLAFYGVELKKDGTPKLRQSGEAIYQRNIIK